MEPNVISLDESLRHIKSRISKEEHCKKEIVDLIEWAISWNKDRSPNNKIFGFLREFEGKNKDEYVNVAFALDRNGNQQKKRKPNFIVIKLANTDQEFKEIHVDFDLTCEGYSNLSEYLIQRRGNRRRWIVKCSEISKMGFDNLQQLFLVAYDRKGGVV